MFEFISDAWKGLTGQTDARATPQEQPFVMDAAATAEYNKAKQIAIDTGQPIPDPKGFQAQYDRQRLLGAAKGYDPLISGLQASAAGQGPSAAAGQYQLAADDATRRAYGMASSGNVAPGQRAALLGQAVTQGQEAAQTAAAQSGVLKAQEQQAARAQLGGALTGRQQALGTLYAGTSGQLAGNQGAATAADQANLGVEQKNAENQSGAIMKGVAAIGGAAAMSDIRGKENIQPLEGGTLGLTGRPTMADFGSAPLSSAPLVYGDKRAAWGGGGNMDSTPWTVDLSQTGGSAERDARMNETALSDIRGKENLHHLSTPAGSRAALAPIEPYSYTYRPELAARTGDDTAPRAGVMAQDLERSPNPVLRSAVVDTPHGKSIDGSRALSANLALSAGLDKRLATIEEELRQRATYPTLGLDRNRMAAP